jgi:hypothetical protein
MTAVLRRRSLSIPGARRAPLGGDVLRLLRSGVLDRNRGVDGRVFARQQDDTADEYEDKESTNPMMSRTSPNEAITPPRPSSRHARSRCSTDRRRAIQERGRRQARSQQRNRQDPHQPDLLQDRRPRPRPSRPLCLPTRPGINRSQRSSWRSPGRRHADLLPPPHEHLERAGEPLRLLRGSRASSKARCGPRSRQRAQRPAGRARQGASPLPW